ncbi:MAG TPA: hypothetical protein VHD56_06205, partial [Tepidisphaeraceae bacterium]|nr:hypothetical protein [Tepidisphaeraceae bacterium]
MARQSSQIHGERSTSSRWWAVLALSLALTGATGWLDYFVGPGVSVLPFYLIAIALAAWGLGSGMAIFICSCATLLSLIVRLETRSTPVADLWNAGMRFGVYLSFALVVGHLRSHNRDFPIFGLVRRAIGVSLVAAIVLMGVGIAIQRSSPGSSPARTDGSSHVALARSADKPAEEPLLPLAKLATHLPVALHDSRAVLLGSRDPNGPSCVAVLLTGDVKETLPANPGDLDGGPGTKKSVLLFFDRGEVKSPLQDYRWQQSRMKKFLENEVAQNRDARVSIHEQFLAAERLAQELGSSVAWPPDILPANFDNHDDWPSYCLWRIDRAAQAKDLSEARHWSRELSGALFSLDDLHSWLDFLCNNELQGLAFASQCRSLFIDGGEPSPDYNTNLNISLYPAGVLVLNGLSNYYEVERQAETIYAWPTDQTGTMPFDQHLTSASLWLPPNLRECYLKLQQVLSPQNQRQWEQAAHTPYEHGYLVNMLYHAWRSDSAEHLSRVLQRFNDNHPDSNLT